MLFFVMQGLDPRLGFSQFSRKNPSSQPSLFDESILVCCKAGVNYGKEKDTTGIRRIPNNLLHTALKLHDVVNIGFTGLKNKADVPRYRITQRDEAAGVSSPARASERSRSAENNGTRRQRPLG